MARMTDWQDTIVSELVASGGVAVNSLTGVLTLGEQRGMTLVRTLVRLDFSSNTVAGAWGVNQLDFGIGVSSQQAFAVGVTALPNPSQAAGKPPRGWVYRSTQGVAQNGVGSPVLYSLTADIRGARKVEDGELFLMMANTAIQGTAMGINIRGMIRALFKLG